MKNKTLKYDDSINMNLVKYIKKGQTVLDVGCYKGALGDYLSTNLDCKVYGVDINKDSISIAKKRLIDARVCNLESESIPFSKKFDVIVIGDVIEHLAYPIPVLKMLKRYLNKGGYFVVSVPNVAHFSVRLKLLFGKFDYESKGIMDNTHLRFYTSKSIKIVFKSSGLKINYLDYAFGIHVPKIMSNGNAFNVFLKTVKKILIMTMPSLFASHLILEASYEK